MFKELERWSTKQKLKDYFTENIDSNGKYFLDLYDGKIHSFEKYKFRRVGKTFLSEYPLYCDTDIFYEIFEEELRRRELWYAIGAVKGRDYTLVVNPECKASTKKPWIIDGYLTKEDIPDSLTIRFLKWIYHKYIL